MAQHLHVVIVIVTLSMSFEEIFVLALVISILSSHGPVLYLSLRDTETVDGLAFVILRTEGDLRWDFVRVNTYICTCTCTRTCTHI